ncbi:hypothetical protein VTK73DRAFT_6976 [Phialemonium thermophilum]|uniref:Uncharacterized protein n=1 Tax=Phialemonium thermophilum TaxID=223376 RepID=A0ABR3WHE1_9PEZI
MTVPRRYTREQILFLLQYRCPPKGSSLARLSRDDIVRLFKARYPDMEFGISQLKYIFSTYSNEPDFGNRALNQVHQKRPAEGETSSQEGVQEKKAKTRRTGPAATEGPRAGAAALRPVMPAAPAPTTSAMGSTPSYFAQRPTMPHGYDADDHQHPEGHSCVNRPGWQSRVPASATHDNVTQDLPRQAELQGAHVVAADCPASPPPVLVERYLRDVRRPVQPAEPAWEEDAHDSCPIGTRHRHHADGSVTFESLASVLSFWKPTRSQMPSDNGGPTSYGSQGIVPETLRPSPVVGGPVGGGVAGRANATEGLSMAQIGGRQRLAGDWGQQNAPRSSVPQSAPLTSPRRVGGTYVGGSGASQVQGGGGSAGPTHFHGRLLGPPQGLDDDISGLADLLWDQNTQGRGEGGNEKGKDGGQE